MYLWFLMISLVLIQRPLRTHREQEDALNLMILYGVYKGVSGEIPSGLCFARVQVI
jgi:hypothetical protein